MKTVERAHLPNRMWEKIRLPSNYQKALAMIDEKLMCVTMVYLSPTGPRFLLTP